jgi:hypothetical protein
VRRALALIEKLKKKKRFGVLEIGRVTPLPQSRASQESAAAP